MTLHIIISHFVTSNSFDIDLFFLLNAPLAPVFSLRSENRGTLPA